MSEWVNIQKRDSGSDKTKWVIKIGTEIKNYTSNRYLKRLWGKLPLGYTNTASKLHGREVTDRIGGLSRIWDVPPFLFTKYVTEVTVTVTCISSPASSYDNPTKASEFHRVWLICIAHAVIRFRCWMWRVIMRSKNQLTTNQCVIIDSHSLFNVDRHTHGWCWNHCSLKCWHVMSGWVWWTMSSVITRHFYWCVSLRTASSAARRCCDVQNVMTSRSVLLL